MEKCIHCGKEIYHPAKICHHCGGEINSKMKFDEGVQKSDVSDKTLGIIAYITLIGFVLALILSNGREKSEFLKLQLSQSLALTLCHMACIMVPVAGWLCSIIVFVAWILALVYACQGKMKPLPIIGELKIFG